MSTQPGIQAESDGPVLDDEGHWHAKDAEIDLSVYRWEDWLTLAMFWLLALDVFYQFFTRYVLSDSAAWTEEIARYLLIIVTFVGALDGGPAQHAYPRRVPVSLPAGCRRPGALHLRRPGPHRPSSPTPAGSPSTSCPGCITCR